MGKHSRPLGGQYYWRCPANDCKHYVWISLDKLAEVNSVFWMFGAPNPIWPYLPTEILERAEALVEIHERTHLERTENAASAS